METVDSVTVRCLAKSEHFECKLGKKKHKSNRVVGHSSAEIIDALKIFQVHRPDWECMWGTLKTPWRSYPGRL